MMLSIHSTKFKIRQYHVRAVSSNLTLAKVTGNTIMVINADDINILLHVGSQKLDPFGVHLVYTAQLPLEHGCCKSQLMSVLDGERSVLGVSYQSREEPLNCHPLTQPNFSDCTSPATVNTNMYVIATSGYSYGNSLMVLEILANTV